MSLSSAVAVCAGFSWRAVALFQPDPAAGADSGALRQGLCIHALDSERLHRVRTVDAK